MKIEFDSLKPITTAKLFITSLIFLALSMMYGMGFREAQQMFFVCGIIALVSLFMKNIWITAFILWSVFSYISHGFQLGTIYLTNIFFGSVLYMFSLTCFKREDIDKYLNVFMWFVAGNMLYTVLQVCRWDFLFQMIIMTKQNGFEGLTESNDPVGFMAFSSAMGMLMALATPIIMTRSWKLAIPLGILMIVPIYLSSASIAVIAWIFSVIFCLCYKRFPYKIKKFKTAIIIGISLAFLLGGILYATKKDDALASFGARANQWKLVLRDAVIHPVAGWGMDSFRNITPEKKWHYAQNLTKLTNNPNYGVEIWDNPHNAFVSFAFEWGFTGVVIVLGYLGAMIVSFRRSRKLPNTIALFGVCMVTVILSISHFPLFLARFMCFIVPMAAMLEVTMRNDDV